MNQNTVKMTIFRVNVQTLTHEPTIPKKDKILTIKTQTNPLTHAMTHSPFLPLFPL